MQKHQHCRNLVNFQWICHGISFAMVMTSHLNLLQYLSVPLTGFCFIALTAHGYLRAICHTKPPGKKHYLSDFLEINAVEEHCGLYIKKRGKYFQNQWLIPHPVTMVSAKFIAVVVENSYPAQNCPLMYKYTASMKPPTLVNFPLALPSSQTLYNIYQFCHWLSTVLSVKVMPLGKSYCKWKFCHVPSTALAVKQLTGQILTLVEV